MRILMKLSLSNFTLTFFALLVGLCAAYGQTVESPFVIDTVAGSLSGFVFANGLPATDLLLLEPDGVAVGANGNFYLSDNSSRSVVLRVAPDGTSTVDGSTLVTVTGTRGFSGDGGPAHLASLSNPQDVALDDAGNLYAADTENHRIRLLTAVPVIPENSLKNAASFVGASVARGSIVSLVRSESRRRDGRGGRQAVAHDAGWRDADPHRQRGGGP